MSAGSDDGCVDSGVEVDVADVDGAEGGVADQNLERSGAQGRRQTLDEVLALVALAEAFGALGEVFVRDTEGNHRLARRVLEGVQLVGGDSVGGLDGEGGEEEVAELSPELSGTVFEVSSAIIEAASQKPVAHRVLLDGHRESGQPERVRDVVSPHLELEAIQSAGDVQAVALEVDLGERELGEVDDLLS